MAIVQNRCCSQLTDATASVLPVVAHHIVIVDALLLQLCTCFVLCVLHASCCLSPVVPFVAAGVTWKAQNQAAVLLAAGQKGHRYTFPHAKISTAPPIMNRVFGQVVDAQLQANELEYATKYYAAILARSTGKDLATCQKEYLSR